MAENPKIITATKISKKALIASNFVRKKSVSLPYIRYRIARPLLKVLTKIQVSRYESPPWLSPTAIKIFDNILDKSMTGLEYGSGRSTYFFSQRLGFLHSIEHNEEWFEIVRQNVSKLENVKLELVPSHEPREGDLPLQLDSFSPKNEYRSYFEKVLEFSDAYFDFILSDGRARVECLINAIPKLKSGGFIVLDNSERDRYRPVFRILSDWEMVETTTGLTDTIFWFKP